MLLCAPGLYPANRTEPGLQLFAPLRSLNHRFCKTCYAPHPHKPPLFCPFLPEAYLLTKNNIKTCHCEEERRSNLLICFYLGRDCHAALTMTRFYLMLNSPLSAAGEERFNQRSVVGVSRFSNRTIPRKRSLLVPRSR